MNLAKTSFYSFIATVIKIISSIILNKVVAVYIGPSGLAMIGQFQNFSQVAMTAAQGGLNSGIVKYTSEYRTTPSKLEPLLSSALKISLICSFIVSLLLIVGSSWLASILLGSQEFAYLFIVFALTIILFVLNTILLSTLNGLKDIVSYIKINIIQSLSSVIFTSILIIFWDLKGAMFALVTNQSLVFIIALFMVRKSSSLDFSLFYGKYSSAEGRKLFKFSMMSLTTALMVPISHIIIRDFLIDNLGGDSAGNWQAVWHISTMYLMVVTTTLGIYYLPKLSELVDARSLRNEIFNGYKFILPIVCVLSFTIFILKDFIVWLLFTPEFNGMLPLFKWQLIGDVIKIASWLLACTMLAKAMTKIYIITEIIFSLSFILLTMVLVTKYGLIGITYAYAINYTLYLGVMIVLTKKTILDS